MRRPLFSLAVLGLFSVSLLHAALFAEEPAAEKTEKKAPTASKTPDKAQLEKEFEEMLAGVQLVGRFTVVGKEAEAPKEERYTITKVRKIRDDYWQFQTRIQYGKTDVAVPLVLKVVWAEDTPMISMTDFTIPGMGTFSARVLFHRGWYAGTWQHGDVGGHLFGKIEKLPPREDKPANDKADKPAPEEKK